uniref:Uncharacterized protein n=1 Tax=Amphora coffeiformis TaxID=265554 RepID=A0A6S8IZL8_9STRA|mmetsp:Transcript_21345/g.40558  ORF Transcript_21345/g.40558 Transcript_21345/m.40558 type:complete len:277 (-) Transcript_21345:41-871(-)|eukprot:scaffold2224_cov154-Amphora_coffeaeformis.AAC.3
MKTTTNHRILRCLLVCTASCSAFMFEHAISTGIEQKSRSSVTRWATPEEKPLVSDIGTSRRALIEDVLVFTSSVGMTVFGPTPAFADFTPGGTLVDREVGVQVGNPQASASRKPDNTNVLFAQDNYFKFGVAAPWIEPDSTEYPKTVPFVRTQQRYDALKKYGPRIINGLFEIKEVGNIPRSEVKDPTAADVYQLRPMGLLANNFLASENTGVNNELFLARWYINELYLLINDLRNATTDEDAKSIVAAVRSAANSYLALMNRVITPKVGDKLPYI